MMGEIIGTLNRVPLNLPLDDFKNILDVSKPLAIDTETTGLYRGIRLVQMFQSHWDAPLVYDVRDVPLRDIFETIRDCTWVIHNASFDLQCFLADLGHTQCEVRDFEDTLLLAKLVWADREIGFSLDECFAYIKGVDVYAEVLSHFYDGTKKITKSMMQKSFLNTKTRDGSKMDVTKLQIVYSALDVLLLLELWEIVNALKEQNENYKWLYELDKSFIRYALIWQQRGVPLNQKFLAEEKERLQKTLVEMETHIKKVLLGDESINIWSPLQLKRKLGVESTSKEALGILAFGDEPQIAEIAKNLLEVRRVKKRLSFVKEYEGCDRIYGYFGCSTSTGRARVSGSEVKGEVNIAQFPRALHHCIDAGDKFFAYADFTNLEVRCAAAVTKCETLKKVLNGGLDMHTYSAQKIFKKADVTPEERHLGKIANFAALYMCGPVRFKAVVKEQSGVDRSVEECSQMLRDWRAAYPGIDKWHCSYLEKVRGGKKKDVKDTERIPAKGLTPCGRMIYSRIYSETAGGQCQGYGAEVAKYVLNILHKKYPHLRLILFMHDSYVVECDTFEEAKEAAKILAVEMTFAWDSLTKYFANIEDLYMPIDAEVVKNLDGEKYWVVKTDGRGGIAEERGEAFEKLSQI